MVVTASTVAAQAPTMARPGLLEAIDHYTGVTGRVDDHRARRLVSDETYRLSLAADGRAVPLKDPLTLLVADFVRVLSKQGSSPPATRSGEIVERMHLLGDIVAGYERAAERR